MFANDAKLQTPWDLIVSACEKPSIGSSCGPLNGSVLAQRDPRGSFIIQFLKACRQTGPLGHSKAGVNGIYPTAFFSLVECFKASKGQQRPVKAVFLPPPCWDQLSSRQFHPLPPGASLSLFGQAQNFKVSLNLLPPPHSSPLGSPG